MPNSPQHRDPIFYDSGRKRWRWILRLTYLLLLLAVGGLGVFAVSIWSKPLLPHHSLPRLHEGKDTPSTDPELADRNRAKRHYVLKRDERDLRRAIAREKLQTVEQPFTAPKNTSESAACVGFYVNWEETSKASLERNITSLTHFIPEWLHLKESSTEIEDARIPEDREEVTPLVRRNHVPIFPILNNYVNSTLHEHQGRWSSEVLHQLLSDPQKRSVLITNLKAIVEREKWQGVTIDFEQMQEEDTEYLTRFMQELYTVFHSVGLKVIQTFAIEDPSIDRPAIVKYTDMLIPLLYDEHASGAEGGGAGSLASMAWTVEQLRILFEEEKIPPQKTVLALGNYAYDWQEGDLNAESMSFQAAVIQAKESQDPQDQTLGHITLDKKTLNPYYRYMDEEGKAHQVWMLDATTTYNQWRVAQKYKPQGVALWYLGGEDPSVWQIIDKRCLRQDQGAEVDKGLLNNVTYRRQSQVDFEGEGEILSIVAEPTDGKRTVQRDTKTGFVTSAAYQSYPSAWVVRRAGFKPKKILLTFDDGPDPTYTPKILDILKQYNVPATFFIVGSQAAEHPDLLARIWSEGHEIGNHTFLHPNLSKVGEKRTLLELSTTQRAIEAIIGRSTTLFRPPYAVDMEPRTADDLKPILIASRFNFLAIGNANDPQDWNLLGVDGTPPITSARLVENVWADRDKGNIVLLHDGGGDRSATVTALPQIIERLRAGGYTFTSLADLRGVTRDELMPKVQSNETLLVGIDHWVFEFTYWLQRILATLFTLSVILGISRQVLMGNLALFQFNRERKDAKTLPTDFKIGVSVVIAAYNEEKVIHRTIQTVLDSTYPVLEVIVVDDGSKDDTTGVVERLFGEDARVRCFKKENGGKATALNYGMQYVQGEVIIALDADTLFTKETIGQLVRHFSDPSVGAVAGNVQVGNVQNLLTRWQALEYITSQNFDRRAYDLMNCITVVPGAVGAWRKAAIDQVGGYSHDTLAEDADLTWSVRQAGYRIKNDSTALAFTEAPETLRALSRQRFRWAFGTLQNLWKHRRAFGQHGAFGLVALPSLWVYGVLFPAISPIMDVAVIWALVSGNFAYVAFYYMLMVMAEFLGAVMAIWMDKANWRLLPSLFIQRFVYRQLMYYVILRSVVAALKGSAVGWNKLERTGNAQANS